MSTRDLCHIERNAYVDALLDLSESERMTDLKLFALTLMEEFEQFPEEEVYATLYDAVRTCH